MENNQSVAIYTSEGKAVELTVPIIKRYICAQATDAEAFMFMQICRTLNLNPFLKEAYCIKYGNEAATMVVGKDTYLKRAFKHPRYKGHKAGIIVLHDRKVVTRPGSFYIPEVEKLVGGWAEVYLMAPDDKKFIEVAINEYIQFKNEKQQDGSYKQVPNRFWREKPATMIRKVALSQALREAFPTEFAGTYTAEEIGIDSMTLEDYNIDRPLIEEPKPAAATPGLSNLPPKDEKDPGSKPNTPPVPNDPPEAPERKEKNRPVDFVPATQDQLKKIRDLFGKLGAKDDPEMIKVINSQLKTDLEAFDDISFKDAGRIIDKLKTLVK